MRATRLHNIVQTNPQFVIVDYARILRITHSRLVEIILQLDKDAVVTSHGLHGQSMENKFKDF